MLLFTLIYLQHTKCLGFFSLLMTVTTVCFWLVMVTEGCLQSTVKWVPRVIPSIHCFMPQAFSWSQPRVLLGKHGIEYGTNNLLVFLFLKFPYSEFYYFGTLDFFPFSDCWKVTSEDNFSWDFDFMAIFGNFWCVTSWNSDCHC